MKPTAFVIALFAGILPQLIADDSKSIKPHPKALPNTHKPGEVDNPKLVPFIVKSPKRLPGIVLDETDAQLEGSWRYSTHTPPYVGIGYLHDQKKNKGKSSVTYTPDIPREGIYEVRLSHCYNVRRSTNTPITIQHADAKTTWRINQQQIPEHDRLFRSLGKFRFRAGKEGYVRISTEGTDGKYVIADAIQFLPVPSPIVTQPKLLFESGKLYKRFRIPSLIVAPDGTLLAFCEGRKDGGGLTGNIDIVVRRSKDHGKSWSPIDVVQDYGNDTLGNPCAFIDRQKNRLWMAFTHSPGKFTEKQIVNGESPESTRVFLIHSDDSGVTWSKPTEITKSVKLDSWTWYGTGPGLGLQLSTGRLVVPCYHVERSDRIYRSHVIYSDDHGVTWQRSTTIGDNTSEAHIAEQSSGVLIMDTRTVVGTKLRTWAKSKDGGKTWSRPYFNKALFDPHCEACLLPLPEDVNSQHVWLFSNPTGPRRHNLTLRVSLDQGHTWSKSQLIQAGDSQYSSLAQLPEGKVGCLYDRWTNNTYQLFFTRIDLEMLLRQK
ncbi:MAG: hypothetical protein CMJ78_09080 [Planctomycetaceae bacterium]|nr:hypothetical protein [Planctomycetaceae bacterium]